MSRSPAERDGNMDEQQVRQVRRDIPAWLRYEDRNAPRYHPVGSTNVTTNRHWDVQHENPSSENWISEGWTIRSELVALGEIERAADTRWDDSPLIEVGWDDETDFNFGESSLAHGVTLLPWCLVWNHPVHDDLRVQLRRDFSLYHALDEREPGKFYHPLDQTLVAEIRIDTHSFLAPTPNVMVHQGYLRDFLAARQLGMLIRIVADRFVNARAEADLGISTTDVEPVEPGIWIRTTVGSSRRLGCDGRMGRSSLWRNIVISPSDKPHTERTPWLYLYERETEVESPTFIIDSDGRRGQLHEPEWPHYLFFKPEVLQKYLKTPGYRVSFPMRYAGYARPIGSGRSIDVGINSEGLVTAFAPDLAELRPSEQAHWAAHSTVPSGGWCENLFRTRMLNNPPDAPGIIDLVREAISALNASFRERYGIDLHNMTEPDQRILNCLSVGPLTSNWQELDEVVRGLTGWVIEGMRVKSLRAAIGERVEFKSDFKQIKLLRCLLEAEQIPADEIGDLVRPFLGLNKLRIAAAHPVNVDLAAAFSLLGTSPPAMPAPGWHACVDSVAAALRAVAERLKV